MIFYPLIVIFEPNIRLEILNLDTPFTQNVHLQNDVKISFNARWTSIISHMYILSGYNQYFEWFFFQTLCYLTSWWSWWCCWLILLCCWLNGNVLARDFPLRGPKGLDWEPLDVILLPKAALLRATPSFSANPPPKVSERRVAEKRSCVVTWKISKLFTWRHVCTSNFNYLKGGPFFATQKIGTLEERTTYYSNTNISPPTRPSGESHLRSQNSNEIMLAKFQPFSLKTAVVNRGQTKQTDRWEI